MQHGSSPFSFDDLQERLLELGGGAKKKTTSAVGKGLHNAINKTFEMATGTKSQSEEVGKEGNHTQIPPHLIDAAHQHKDQQDLSKVRSQLANYQNGDTDKNKEQSALQSFFRKYKQEEESYQMKKIREEKQKKQQEEYEELEKKKREEQARTQQLDNAAPQGKVRKNIFAKVKKRSSMIETKASSGKQ